MSRPLTPLTPLPVLPVLPGLAVAVAIAVLATLLARGVPVLGAPVLGVAIGVVVAAVLTAVRRRPGVLGPGIRFASRFVLQSSVVLLGTGLSLDEAARVGLKSLPVLVGTLAVCLVGAWLAGRALGVAGDVRTLIGVGTGVCGASAIAAVGPVIGAAATELAYAVSTIFLFNVVAVLLFPLVGHALGLGQHAFGVFAGTAVNDTSSVVAAATGYGAGARDTAVVVKLVRTLAIVPIVLALSFRTRRTTAAGSRSDEGRGRLRLSRLVPWFLVGFVLAAAADTVGLIPAAAHPALSSVATFLITIALAGVGLSTDPGAFRRAGWRPLLLGGILWALVSATSLGLQALSGRL